jgi:hypothetical protein
MILLVLQLDDVEKCTSFFNFNLLLPVSKAAKNVTLKV